MKKLFTPKVELVESTPFSDFIRNAKSAEKKRVYARVLKKAAEKQNKVIEDAKLA